VVLVALAVGAVTDRLTLSRDESKVLEFIENIRAKQVRTLIFFWNAKSADRIWLSGAESS
jgi:hypothetical protein